MRSVGYDMSLIDTWDARHQKAYVYLCLNCPNAESDHPLRPLCLPRGVDPLVQ